MKGDPNGTHTPEYVEVYTASGNLRWRCTCSCGWYTMQTKSSAYWAQRSYQEHMKRVEARRAGGGDVRQAV